MPHTTQSSDFWGWYLRHNSRTVWKYLADAGIDTFAAGPSNNPQAFLDLTNVIPAMSGGFNQRWGIQNYVSQNPYTPAAAGAFRMIPYNFPQDASNVANTADTNLWMFTNGSLWTVFTDAGVPFGGHGPRNFSFIGDPYGTNSRGYFYYSNGKEPPRKVNPSYTTANTESLMGIALSGSPTGSPAAVDVPCVLGPTTGVTWIPVTHYPASTGYGYTVPPAVTVTDVSGGTGAGCVITTSLGVHGEVNGFSITNPGAGYTQAQATLSAPPAGGVQASLVLYTQTNASAPLAGQVVGADFGGQINLVAGRQYTVALQNSLTGHTSDVYIGQALPTFTAGHPFLDGLTGDYSSNNFSAIGSLPVYAASTNATAGTTQLEVVIAVPLANLDPQVDTVVLLAGADGQGTSTLYEVATIPLSSFTFSAGNGYYFYYLDILPDALNDQHTSGDTLLAADIWAETASDGSSNGIFLNTPPPSNIKYLTQHQGRLFGSDGKSIFFSKSLDEVTTSTGLITSKWEECWPGDYQLAVALSNEEINSIKSDGTNLHVGTEKSIFTIYGSDPESFSVPSVAFAETGVLSNDCWSVIYAEGQPSGYMWITPDLKVIHSDFSTYREVGTPIYPILQQLDMTRLQNCKVMSLTYGPYNFAILGVYLQNTGRYFEPTFLIYETRLGKWYRWILPSAYSSVVLGINTAVTVPFVYQFPAFTGSSQAPGSRFLFFWQYSNGVSTKIVNVDYFNPAQLQDIGGNNVLWNVQTSWQDLGDPTSIKVANEIEIAGDCSTYFVSLFGATAQSQFDSGGVLLRTGTTVTGPMAALATNKFYLAGAPTAAKYYSIQIQSSSATSTNALTSFSLETYPMARI